MHAAAAAAALSQKAQKVRSTHGKVWVQIHLRNTCDSKKLKRKAKQKRGLESEWKYEKSCALSLSLSGALRSLFRPPPPQLLTTTKSSQACCYSGNIHDNQQKTIQCRFNCTLRLAKLIKRIKTEHVFKLFDLVWFRSAGLISWYWLGIFINQSRIKVSTNRTPGTPRLDKIPKLSCFSYWRLSLTNLSV